jgi:hypothetical protein
LQTESRAIAAQSAVMLGGITGYSGRNHARFGRDRPHAPRNRARLHLESAVMPGVIAHDYHRNRR